MNLKELIKKGESEKIEFKKSLGLKDEIGKAISAFSNSNGGKIIVGVDDKTKQIIGVEIGKNTIETLANYIKQNTDPQVFPQVMVGGVDDKELIVIEVKEADEKPVLFKGRPYKRVGKSTHKVSSAEIRKLVREERRELNWDEKINKDTTLDDIDREKLNWFLRIARAKRGLTISEDAPINDILTHLKLLNKDGLTNAAIILFSKNTERFFLQSEVKCIALPTTEFVKPYNIYHSYSGNLFEQVDKAIAFILENIKRPLWIEPGEVMARHPYEIPKDVVREAIVNAIVHRDYTSSSKVQVRVFPDRVEIWNPGQLPPQLGLDDLKKPHPSLPYNPLLFRQFYRAVYVEDAGGGTIDIIRGCKNANLPEPKFEQRMGCFILTIYRSRLTDEYLDSIDLNERQRKAIEFIKKKRGITNMDYQQINNVSRQTAQRDLSYLVKKNIVKRMGKGRDAHYKFK